MTRVWRVGVSAFVLSAVAAACGGDSATSSATVTLAGTWKSSAVAGGSGGANIIITLTLAQSGTIVTGSGTTNETPPAVIVVTGTYDKPTVNLVLQVQAQGGVDQNKPPMPFAGTSSDGSVMTGTLEGGTVTFTKQ